MVAQVRIQCECGCGRSRLVREADIKRGWGRFYDKSCKAKAQAKKQSKKPRRQVPPSLVSHLIRNCDMHYARSLNGYDDEEFDEMDGHFSNEDN